MEDRTGWRARGWGQSGGWCLFRDRIRHPLNGLRGMRIRTRKRDHPSGLCSFSIRPAGRARLSRTRAHGEGKGPAKGTQSRVLIRTFSYSLAGSILARRRYTSFLSVIFTSKTCVPRLMVNSYVPPRALNLSQSFWMVNLEAGLPLMAINSSPTCKRESAAGVFG